MPLSSLKRIQLCRPLSQSTLLISTLMSRPQYEIRFVYLRWLLIQAFTSFIQVTYFTVKDREELAGKLRSTYFDGNDKADIVKEIEGLKKGVDHECHVCVAAGPSRYSVSILIVQPSLCLICRQGGWTPLGRIRSKIAQLHAGEAETT